MGEGEEKRGEKGEKRGEKRREKKKKKKYIKSTFFLLEFFVVDLKMKE